MKNHCERDIWIPGWRMLTDYDGAEVNKDGRHETGYLKAFTGEDLQIWLNSEARGHSGNRFNWYVYARVSDSESRSGWIPSVLLDKVNTKSSNT